METLPPGGRSALANGLRSRLSTISVTNRKSTTFRIASGLEFILRGKRSRIMQWLIAADTNGVTQMDVVHISIRLASIIFYLTRRHGIEIRVEMEPNPASSGLHARYFLISKVSTCAV